MGVQLRKGRVTDIDTEACCVRVIFPDSGLVSGWLSALRHGDGGLPDLDDTVLCVYDCKSDDDVDADGFVLGVIS